MSKTPVLEGKSKFAVILTAVVLVAHIYAYLFYPFYCGRSVKVDGFVEKRFEDVKRVFERNFLEGFERDGANVAVYHRGRQVVNLWAGQADSVENKPWRANTRTVLFSATKPIAAICVAILVDKGLIHWTDRVASFWPEYGQNGKETTTVEHVLAHQAGLPYIDEAIRYEDALSPDRVLKLIERASPIWKPGTESGYHAVTFGWIVDGIIRHADPQHRDIHTFFEEEVAAPLNLDLSIGLRNEAEFARSAVLTQPTYMEYLRDSIMDIRILVMIAAYYGQPMDSVLNKIGRNHDFLDIDRNSFNSIRVQRLKLGSTNGLGNANDVAMLFSRFLNGSIVKPELVQQMSRPTLANWHWEKTVFYPLMKGHGFFYDYHPQGGIYPLQDKFVFGHPGYGCQALYIDPQNDLVVVYLSNGLKSATSHLCVPYQRLSSSVYKSL